MTRSDPQTILARAMREKALVAHIVKAAGSLGYRVTHFTTTSTEGRYRTALQGDKGFVDLVLANGRCVFFVECKTETGNLSPDQDAWLNMLNVTGRVHVRVWRPSDWLSGAIEREMMEYAR